MSIGHRFDSILRDISEGVASAGGAREETWRALAEKIVSSSHVHLESLERELTRTLGDLREGVRAEGPASARALSALCRVTVALSCCGEAESADAARRAYEAWTTIAAAALGARGAETFAEVGIILGKDGKHADAVRALEIAVAAGAGALLASTSDAASSAMVARGVEHARLLGVALSASGDTDRAARVLGELSDELLREGSKDALRVRTTYADVLFGAGRYDEARTVFEDLAARAPDSNTRREALFGAARATHGGGEESEARARLTALMKDAQNDGALATLFGVRIVEELLGMLLSAQDDGAAAIQRELLSATIAAVGPNHPRALREESNLAAVLVDVELREEAEAILRAVLARQDAALGKSSPDSIATRRTLARALRWLDKDVELRALEAETDALAGADAPYELPRVHFRGDEPNG